MKEISIKLYLRSNSSLLKMNQIIDESAGSFPEFKILLYRFKFRLNLIQIRLGLFQLIRKSRNTFADG